MAEAGAEADAQTVVRDLITSVQWVVRSFSPAAGYYAAVAIEGRACCLREWDWHADAVVRRRLRNSPQQLGELRRIRLAGHV